ncbi:ISL3 family transposase [Roseomonas sp. SG15]|uniref:ISL3 family transposase n=1 Tax=Roseomonas indoligenes TaxID=2820811 RepID=A0A940S9V0_9PROT|nr:ISL3 family transposase [Pararoseomonas indoligenes]
MRSGIGVAPLVPTGLVVESVVHGEDAIVVAAQGAAAMSACPLCGTLSERVHSRYVRQVADLPWAGRSVRLRLVVRRFLCDLAGCRCRIFAERFGKAVRSDRARRTDRLEGLVHHLGLALGGRPGAGFAQRLMLPVSNDTLLRVVRRLARPRAAPLSVIGIDDWAVRRNHRYGTIVCDLERRRIVALLPDREMATAEAWLRRHPGIGVVSRDLSIGTESGPRIGAQ